MQAKVPCGAAAGNPLRHRRNVVDRYEIDETYFQQIIHSPGWHQSFLASI